MTAPAAPRILHLVDRVAGGVPVAVRTYVANSPAGVEHVIAAPFADGAPAPVWAGTAAALVAWDTSSVPRAVRGLHRLVRAERFDVVHAHSSFPGVYARLLGLGRRTRLVYTPHCFAFLRTDVARPVRGAYRFIEWVLRGRATIVAACGPGEKAEAVGVGVPVDRVLMVPNVASVPVDPADVRRSRAAGAPVNVGMLGRGAPQKDPAFFRARVAELRAALAVPVQAWWIGDAADHDPAVQVTGWLTPAEVAARLRALDLYLHTAAWEGFPIAILDAHAIGLPVLARAIPALPGLPAELTIAGGTGGFVDAVHAGGLAQWSAENHAAWAAYLGPRTPDAQRVALAHAWDVSLGR
ncbi:glycosyltransferase [Microbacterium trichothecenolyticum]|uniref:Glycosyltransferase involved in cell wall biosynthesis n=1 Tax=Microbacterium trichothecenolyticum TaxID=69370 RepID=A0ABU0TXN0_MICTR|nr:glycosyltransferase [Microbacterium trichothecenolyticum]MDQ1124420.1 glycosyltransferase involved in cell wall biosynthesis [Microbacterium trichothecenolyticum]